VDGESVKGGVIFSQLPAWAGHREPGYDLAKVVSTNPVYETVRFPVDEQVCWEELGKKIRIRVHVEPAPY
jgi:hypothetical protein